VVVRAGTYPFTITVLLLLAAASSCQAQTQPAVPFAVSGRAIPSQDTATSASPASQSADQAIPLAQIADRAEETDRLLRQISSELPTSVELQETKRRVEEQAEEMQERVHQTRELLAGAHTRLEVEDEQRYWRSRSQEYAIQRKMSTSRAANLEEQIRILESQQPEWQATLDQIQETPSIEPIVKRVQEQLEKIRATRLQAQEQLNAVLALQNQISQQDQEISEMLLRLRQAREQDRSQILEQDSPPLWEARPSLEIAQVAPELQRFFDRSLTSAADFLRAHKLSTFALLLTYFLLLLGALKLRSYLVGAADPTRSPETVEVLKAPFSVALVVALLATGDYIASAPISIAFIFYLLYLVPVLRLLAPLAQPQARILLYVLAVFYALEGLSLLAPLPPVLGRWAYAVLVLAALISFGWLTRPYGVDPLLIESRRLRMLTVGIRADLLLLVASLVANIVGFAGLAQVFGLIALVAPLLLAALYCGVRVLTLMTTILLRTRWARSVLEMHADAAERWGGRVLAAAASLLWLKAMLQLLTVYDVVRDAVSRLFQYPIGSDRVHFTLGGALSIVVIILVGYVLANAFIFLLREFLLPRLPLQRGLPYAISTIAYYFLLLLIGLAALSAAGVELNKFTVLTGALGVGLGFGLQNIVNNFFSGIVLLFERPIHVGDTVDVGGLVGTVRRIGARSSTVQTFQGAEVIVPNSNLLSNQVINWTLSSQWRRVDIPVGVAYGTDPELVIRLLVGAAESHPGVLLERPPAAFFMGFGESALNFELRFWCARQDTWFQLQSDVTVAVAKALRGAGVAIPFPQRDLHLRTIGASVAETLANDPRTKSSSDPKEKGARI